MKRKSKERLSIKEEAIRKSMGEAKLEIIKNPTTMIYKVQLSKEIGVYNNPLFEKLEILRAGLEECREFRLVILSFND